ncbi:hypothetical protein GNY06_03525, partial [Elizabethkingia argentiflava]|nr:hypothetical protein [Elizabethkingia argenteiflava]
SPVEGIQIPVYRGNQSVVGDSRPLSPEEIRMLTARDPITNLNQFFRCLDRYKPAKLTVYADRNGIGHAFITITQGSNVLTFGFYPKLEALAKRGIGPGILNNDSQHVFSTYLNVGSISPAQLTQIINLAERYQNSWYNLATHNCTTFTKDVMNILGKNMQGLDIPRFFADTLVQMGGVNRPGFGPYTRRSCN